MHQEEALAYLGIKSASDWPEKEKELLFEAKRFFTTQPVVQEVFDRRIEKLIKQQMVAVNLQLSAEEEVSVESISLGNEATLIDQFNSFQQLKNRIKTVIFNAKSFNELVAHAKQLLNLYDQFLQIWDVSFESNDEIRIGKESDPMAILNDLKNLENNSIFTLNELRKNPENCPPTLKKELQRMKLLKDRNEQRRHFSKS